MRNYIIISAITVAFVSLAGAGQAVAVPRSPDAADGNSGLTALSCGVPGNCGAGGYVANSADDSSQVFVVSEKNGRWGKAAELSGLAALNVAKSAALESMSCPSAGNCTAIGFYSIGEYNRRSFAATEKNGRWGKAEVIPGTRHFEVAGVVPLMSVSCSSAGNCGAFGTYATASNVSQSYVVSEARGVWGKAVALRGIVMNAVSCGAAGNCVAGGYSATHAVTVAEIRGKWGKPRDLVGVPVSISGAPKVTSMSCSSAGNCTAGGDYVVNDGVQVFVATESKGTWKKATQLPGIAALNVGGGAGLLSVSCASAGNCAAGGSYVPATNAFEAFVADERGGTWAKAEEVPGTAALNVGSIVNTAAQVNALSCRSPGYCRAGGYYADKNGDQQVFVDSQAHGTWGKAVEVRGAGALNAGGMADLAALSCGSAGHCAAGGYYTDKAMHHHAYVVSQGKGTWGRAQLIPGLALLSARA
jgi:hypothetical protein